MNDIIKDTSTLTTIPEKSIRRLIEKIVYCISDSIVEAIAQDADTVDMDIGLGTLSIKLSGDDAKYKFIPSAYLEDCVRNSILKEQNLLEDVLETSLAEKITHQYKDIVE